MKVHHERAFERENLFKYRLIAGQYLNITPRQNTKRGYWSILCGLKTRYGYVLKKLIRITEPYTVSLCFQTLRRNAHMGKVIAIANQKGGVGKTTSAVNIASSLAAMEFATVLIDMDPQANSTSALGINPREVPTSVYEVLVGNVPIKEVVLKTEMPHLDLIPSHINLVGAELEMIDLPEREHVLLKALKQLRTQYQFIIIDCPPSLGLLTLNALTGANSVIIPVQSEYFALEGLGQLLNTIKLVRQNLNPALEIEGVLLTMFDARLRLSNQVASEVRRYFGEKVFTTMIHRNVRISEAPSFGKPVILYDATSIGTKNYMAVAKEIIQNNLAQFTSTTVKVAKQTKTPVEKSSS